ncbi:UNVERIFIED_CONTAM: long-chain acyl-CoA synthetase [Acetivibrio alkalicellulosi]
MKKGIDIFFEDDRRIVKGLGYYKPRAINDLKELVKGSVKNFGNTVGFKFKDKKGQIVGKTYIEFDKEIDCLGTALLSLGLKNSRIAIISENRYEWGVCYFSVVNGTGVVVPMDKYLPENEIINLIERGQVDAIFYSPPYHQTMTQISQSNKKIKYYICIEKNNNTVGSDNRFLNMPDLISKGKSLIDEGDLNFIDTQIDKDKLSVLLFTSGTTSMSKGVMLSHSNIASNVTSVSTSIQIGPGDVHLSLLPLHHTFENTIGLLMMVHSGVCIAYCDGIKYIAQNILEYNVSILVAVPAIFEAMHKKLIKGIEKSGKAKIVKALIKTSDILRFVGIDIRRKLFKSIFNQLGPKLRIAVSGAAPLDPQVIIWFDKIGLKLLEGYGLTETSPVISVNNDFFIKPGTIGYPLSGIEVAIDSPDQDGIGEIIARGPNVMLGYYEDSDATNEVIDEKGWFKTGDLGIIDNKGFISIRGRAKSMIVFTNGKKAFPEEYEVLLNDIPGVCDSFSWGYLSPNGDVQVCAKLVVDKEAIQTKKGEILKDEDLASLFSDAIKKINDTLPQYKIIRYFILTYEDLVKTTTLKIKRNVEQEKITQKLDSLGLDMRKISGKVIDKL